METLIGLSPIILMFVIFYFLLIRPQQKRQKQVREMQANIQKGDKIVTIGGMHGTVHAIDEETIVLISDDGNKLTFNRNAVGDVVQS